MDDAKVKDIDSQSVIVWQSKTISATNVAKDLYVLAHGAAAVHSYGYLLFIY